MTATKLLGFANLLETARLCALSNTYEKQRELIAFCRREGRAFIASMPVRHRFRCPQCGVETGEVELHFEDPAQPRLSTASDGMWGKPVGLHFATSFSAFHSMIEHSNEMPAAFFDLLKGIRP